MIFSGNFVCKERDKGVLHIDNTSWSATNSKLDSFKSTSVAVKKLILICNFLYVPSSDKRETYTEIPRSQHPTSF